MPFYEINICQVMIFRLYTVYNKHEMIKIGSQIRENLLVLSQVLEKFCCRLYLKLTVGSGTHKGTKEVNEARR